MAEIAVPDPQRIEIKRIDLDTPTQVNRSGWTGGRKGIGLPGAQRWYASALIEDLATEDEERPWRAFLFGLRGPQKWFRLPLGCQPVAVNPTVRAGTATSRSVPLANMPGNTTFLRAGAWLTIALPSGRFRTVTLMQDLTTNGQGQGTAVFEPEINEAPAVGAVVNAMAPFIPMSLADPRAGMSWGQALGSISLELEEAA